MEKKQNKEFTTGNEKQSYAYVQPAITVLNINTEGRLLTQSPGETDNIDGD